MWNCFCYSQNCNYAMFCFQVTAILVSIVKAYNTETIGSGYLENFSLKNETCLAKWPEGNMRFTLKKRDPFGILLWDGFFPTLDYFASILDLPVWVKFSDLTFLCIYYHIEINQQIQTLPLSSFRFGVRVENAQK